MTKLLGLVVFLFFSVSLTNARAIATTNNTLSVDDVLATYENDSSCQELNMAYPKLRDSTFSSDPICCESGYASFNTPCPKPTGLVCSLAEGADCNEFVGGSCGKHLFCVPGKQGTTKKSYTSGKCTKIDNKARKAFPKEVARSEEEMAMHKGVPKCKSRDEEHQCRCADRTNCTAPGVKKGWCWLENVATLINPKIMCYDDATYVSLNKACDPNEKPFSMTHPTTKQHEAEMKEMFEWRHKYKIKHLRHLRQGEDTIDKAKKDKSESKAEFDDDEEYYGWDESYEEETGGTDRKWKMRMATDPEDEAEEDILDDEEDYVTDEEEDMDDEEDYVTDEEEEDLDEDYDEEPWEEVDEEDVEAEAVKEEIPEKVQDEADTEVDDNEDKSYRDLDAEAVKEEKTEDEDKVLDKYLDQWDGGAVEAEAVKVEIPEQVQDEADTEIDDNEHRNYIDLDAEAVKEEIPEEAQDDEETEVEYNEDGSHASLDAEAVKEEKTEDEDKVLDKYLDQWNVNELGDKKGHPLAEGVKKLDKKKHDEKKELEDLEEKGLKALAVKEEKSKHALGDDHAMIDNFHDLWKVGHGKL